MSSHQRILDGLDGMHREIGSSIATFILSEIEKRDAFWSQYWEDRQHITNHAILDSQMEIMQVINQRQTETLQFVESISRTMTEQLEKILSCVQSIYDATTIQAFLNVDETRSVLDQPSTSAGSFGPILNIMDDSDPSTRS